MLDIITPPLETVPKECKELIEKIVNSGLLLYTYYFESKDKFVIRFFDRSTLEAFQKVYRDMVEPPISEIYYNVNKGEYTIRLIRITDDLLTSSPP